MDLFDALIVLSLSMIGHIIVTGLAMYAGWWWGKKQGERSYQAAEERIRNYVKTELVGDLTAALKDYIRDQINGIFGPVAKAGIAESRDVALQYAQQNPGIMQLLTGVATKAGISWGLKQLGAPKEVRDAFKITGGGFNPIQLPGSRQGKNDELAPVKTPGP